MGRGLNVVAVGGNVTKDIEYGETTQGDPFCTFTLVSEKKDRRKRTIVRINVYQSGLVDVCRERLTDGIWVVVDGELMNPDKRTGCEVRCQEIVFR